MKGYNLPKSVQPSGPAVWLQEVGWVQAKPAKDLQVGEERCYNFGYHHPITKVEQKGNTIYLTTVDELGKEFIEKKRAETLVPFQDSPETIKEEVRQNLIKGAQ